nr:hypothetical protein CFP56_36741 [Quercus suber]
MADELEALWSKLTVTEEEGEGIELGSDSTKAAREIGKNCLVMKILTQRIIGLEALRKHLKMIWKPKKGLQVSEIGEEMYLAEFGDGRDKRRILEMCPWSYEKQLILLQDFEGERVPKEITIKWSPFWVQIYNLPLKSMTRESGIEIGAKIGRVLDVDVPENGVHWGKFLRVRVQIDATKRLVRGKRVTIEGGESRRGGREPVKIGEEVRPEIRPEPSTHGMETLRRRDMPELGENHVNKQNLCQKVGHSDKTKRLGAVNQESKTFHGEGKVNLPQGKENESLTQNRKDSLVDSLPHADLERGIHREKSKIEEGSGMGEERLNMMEICGETSPKENDSKACVEGNSSPLAMSFIQEKVWVAKPLGPNSGHWKHLELDPNALSTKRKKGLNKEESEADMRIWLAVRRCLLRSTAEPNECVILELPGVRVSSGNSYTHRRGERQKPRGGVLGRDKSNHKQNEGLSTQTGFYSRNHCSE